MVRRIPIRAKVAIALAVPLLALVAAAGFGASANAAEARRVARQADLATASIGHAGLISALQNERNQATFEMLGLANQVQLEVDDRGTARELTDSARNALHREIAGADDTLRGDYTAALDTLDRLAEVRDKVDGAAATPGPANRAVAHDAFKIYTSMVSALFASHDRFSLVVDDGRLRQGDDLVHYSSHATDAAAQLVEMLIYHGTGFGGIDTPAEAAEVAELRRDVDRNNAVVRTKGVGSYAASTQALFANPRIEGLSALAKQSVEVGGTVDTAQVIATTPLGPGGGYMTYRDEVVDVLDATALDLRHAAESRRRLYLGGALAIVILAVGVAWRVSRSISRPLRDLSRVARDIATTRLPEAVQGILSAPAGDDIVVPEAEPVAVSRDEVGDVAGALNEVQRSALGLAVEQAALRRNIAESYVNLGRRNQNLLSRLLDAVGELERGEADPDRLNQLYRLDHLATRIRRNAESLLVLSETSPPTRWQPPVQVADVVRAALGEVENYDRVLVRTLEPALVLGGASADLAHLLAELIENGLRHSPPRELVEVSGKLGRDGYSLVVVDHGLGMTPEDIERANQRLAGAESFAVTPAKYLGHYVTGVLAARHGITVRLQGSVVVGIAAMVDLPAALITDQAAGTNFNPPPAELPSAPSWIEKAARATGEFAAVPADEPGEQPSPDDVRSAVALLRTRSSTPPRRPQVAAMATTARAEVSTIVPRHRPARSERGRSGGMGPPDLGFAGAESPVPERTASGLVRRVRRTAPAAARASDTGPTPVTPEPVATTRPASIDGAEMQRFLTNLAGGVQRSLDEQASTPGGRDEG
ncbi:MAG TPA: ATP-binding protein [Acidimicrobiales bacterium]|nr:ATP-binding protein [Acidimicrobiales bacterium]